MHEIVVRLVSMWAEGDGGGKEGEGQRGKPGLNNEPDWEVKAKCI